MAYDAKEKGLVTPKCSFSEIGGLSLIFFGKNEFRVLEGIK